MDQKVKIKKPNKQISTEDLEKLSKEELIARIQSMHAHNVQLQNIINKSNSSTVAHRKTSDTKKFDFSKCRFRHILLRLFYLGWDYSGFATQEDTTNTIEYYLFEALTRTCLIKDRSSSNYHRCGRTDKGVSSFGQVISIDIRSRLSQENEQNLDEEIDYCKILNKTLPANIQCVAWAPADSSFSARFDCRSRTYKYYFPKGTLDVDRMRNASKYLIGSHDFRNFAKMDVGNGVVEFIRNFMDFRIEACDLNKDNDEYSMYVATIKGNAFIWHQIRYIMGILFLIGANKEEPEVIKELLDVEKNPRKPEYNMANEVPLNLFFCDYDDVKWHVSQENLKQVVESLQQIWSFSEIKSVMVKDIINNLVAKLSDPGDLKCIGENLVGGVKPKNYIPVMERQKCDSLEDKIKHYSKRKRIEVVSKNDAE